MSEGAHQELHSLRRDQAVTRVIQMVSLILVEMLGKVWFSSVWEDSPSVQIHRTWKRQEPALAPEWLLGPICASALLPADPFTSLCLSFQSRNLEFSSAIPLPLGRSCLNCSFLALSPGKNVPLLPEQYYVIPSSVFPVLLRSRIPGRGTQKEILVCKNTEQNCFRPLFLKQTCLLWWFFSVLTV